MAIRFSPKRGVLPPPNRGAEQLVQRRIEESAARAAERTRTAVRPDAHLCRVWLRNPRGTIVCPCSARASGASPDPVGNVKVIIPPDDGDMLGGPDAGYPLAHIDSVGSEPEQPESVEGTNPNPSFLEDVTRLLLGNGRRCGLCWGTGWINGHRLWGGARVMFCVSDDDYATLTDDSELLVDVDSPTPTFVGPGTVTWDVELPHYCRSVDALRVRDGLQPATGAYKLQARTSADAPNTWRDAAVVLGCSDGAGVPEAVIPDDALTGLQVRLVLGRGVRVSHAELVVRSEPLVHLQLPQLQQAASQEMISPVVMEEFEIDPTIGALERGTLFEVPGVRGRVGSVWIVTDVMNKQTATGSVFGVTGNVRNAQPTDVFRAALMDDSAIGIVDPGTSSRGLESTVGGDPSGVDQQSDDSIAAANRGVQPRVGGGTAKQKPVAIVLSAGDPLDKDPP